MMKPPLVSIVTPVLNRRTSIEACLRSVATQTYPRLEHIVVDGGSTDGTTDVLERFARSHPLSWISERDSGMYSAINKGLKMAKGEILAYLNSDDLYLPYSVASAVEFINKDRPIIYGDLGLFYAEHASAFVPQFYPEFDINYYTHFATIGQPTVFWTRPLMEATGEFDESYRLLGDCEYWLRATTKGFRPAHLEEILAIQVEHGATLRVTNSRLMQTEFARLRAQYLPAAGAPEGRLRWEFKRRINWRKNQVRFILSGSAKSPRAWPEFMRFLADHDIPVNKSGLLWFLLPGPIRPRTATLLDARSLEPALFGTA